jgi:hypothetical protein
MIYKCQSLSVDRPTFRESGATGRDQRAFDVTNVFGPAEGAVALDCAGKRFFDWKIGLICAIVLKETEFSRLFDGLIIY